MAIAHVDVGRQEGDTAPLQIYLSRCLIFPRFVGVFPFRISGGIYVNRIELAISLVINLLSIGVIMVAVTIDVTDHSSKAEFQAAMISFVEGVLVTVSIALSTLTIVMKQKKLKSLYNCLVQVGMLVERIPGKRRPFPSMRRSNIKLLFSVPLMAIICMETRRAIRDSTYGPPLFYLSVYAHCMCNIKLFGVAIEFAVFTEFLGHWFNILYKTMAAPDQYLTGKTVQLASEACDCLVSALEYIRSAFGSTLLIMVVNCFVKSTANFNKLIREDKPYWILLFGLWIINMLMQLLLVVIAANYTIKQVNWMFEWSRSSVDCKWITRSKEV